VSRGALWTARVLNALGVLFLTFDAVIKVLRPPLCLNGSLTWCRRSLGGNVEETPIEVRNSPREVPGIRHRLPVCPASCSLNAQETAASITQWHIKR
jgi:hypothetical protein